MTAASESTLRRRVAEEACRAAADVHRRYRGQTLERDVKQGERSDYATRVDIEAQEAVAQVVGRSFPGEPVVGEESAPEDVQELRRLAENGAWFVDPLDGTAEYAHGNPLYSAIVVYVRGGIPQACAVYFEALGEMLSAALKEGATLNGEAIRTSGQTQLKAAVLSTIYRSTDPEAARQFSTALARLLPLVESARLPGAPGVCACFLAAGRYDVFAPVRTEGVSKPQPWENGAFILLVREAGGAVSSLSGGEPDVMSRSVYAASEPLLRAYLEAVN